MTRRDGAYWLDRVRREHIARDRASLRVALLGYFMCVAAAAGMPLKMVDIGEWR